jgi:protein-tyrosine phosphatase
MDLIFQKPKKWFDNDSIDVSKITSKIYLGSYKRGALNRTGLSKIGITHVLTVGNDMEPEPHKDDFIYKTIFIDDRPEEDISFYFDEAIDFINEGTKPRTKNKIFIHCWAGISRSATITIAYLMKQNRLPYIEAIEKVRQSRWIINPNKGFREKLYILSNELNLGDTIYGIKLYETAFKLLRKHKDVKNEDEHKKLEQFEKNWLIETYKELFGENHVFVSFISKEIYIK